MHVRAVSATAARSLAIALVFACAVAHAQTAPATGAAKKKITRADELPRHEYTLSKLPSELLEGPVEDLFPLADALERDLDADLAANDIDDRPTLGALVSVRVAIAMLRQDWTAVPRLTATMRGYQDKPAARLTAGVLTEIVADAKAAGGDMAAQQASIRVAVADRYGAMPWMEVQDSIKGLKAQMEMANPALIVGAFRAQMDAAARNAGMKLDQGMVAGIIASRVQLDHIVPMRATVASALAPVIERNVVAIKKPDRWSQHLVTLSENAHAKPVVVGIWDSGVDMTLFKPASLPGLAFDEDGRPAGNLLRDLGEAKDQWPELRQLVKGALDLKAALDTPEARRLKEKVASLTPAEAIPFQDSVALAGFYVHGTHVAGIAVAGNPFARVYPVAMHWNHKAVPFKPTEALSQRTAANYATIVASFRKAGARVVNMSWRYGPGGYEDALAYHGIGKDPEARRQMAMKLFAMERDALKAAIASAPEILFVAGSGNENNSADFNEYIPAGLELPNLITAGAVDQAGEETSFSSFGKTVVVYANGFEVDSVVPGGDHLKLSGTSMAAPQVTNLAAKLFALRPELTPVQAKALILDGADRQGRVALINPKATLQPFGA